jgi:hypothetical protein
MPQPAVRVRDSDYPVAPVAPLDPIPSPMLLLWHSDAAGSRARREPLRRSSPDETGEGGKGFACTLDTLIAFSPLLRLLDG